MEKSSQRFLVVDDSPTVRQHLSYLLKLVAESEEQIHEAATAAEAVRQFRLLKPGVVFLDMMLPKEQDGSNVLRLILKDKPDAKVVLVTALDQDHPSVRSAIAQGAAAYVRKPLTVRSLQTVLEELELQSGRFRRVV